MTAPTHIAFGLLTVAGSFAFFSLPLHRNLPAIAGAIIGSVLPDVDSSKSYIGRVLPFASIPIERQWGHRTITHSLLCLIVLSVMIWPLLIWQTPCYTALLTFEGRWRHTREHVRGEGVIPDARPTMFWIIYNGRVQTCGEHGAILLDKVRVRKTDRPYKYRCAN